MSDRSARLFRNVLIGAYVAIPLTVMAGAYQGWLFRSSSIGDGVAAGAFMALLGATMLAESAEVFRPARVGREVIKALGYFAGALAWAALAAALLRENRWGTAVLAGTLTALMLASVFHFCRLMGLCLRFFKSAIMTSTTVPVAPLAVTKTSSVEEPASTGEPGELHRVEVAANNRNIALRLLGGMAAFLVLAQVLKHTPLGGPATLIFYVGAVIFAVLALRHVWNRGPILSVDLEGLSIRRDFSAIRRLSWSQIMGFEMKSATGYTFLVVHVKDADLPGDFRTT